MIMVRVLLAGLSQWFSGLGVRFPEYDFIQLKYTYS